MARSLDGARSNHSDVLALGRLGEILTWVGLSQEYVELNFVPEPSGNAVRQGSANRRAGVTQCVFELLQKWSITDRQGIYEAHKLAGTRSEFEKAGFANAFISLLQWRSPVGRLDTFPYSFITNPNQERLFPGVQKSDASRLVTETVLPCRIIENGRVTFPDWAQSAFSLGFVPTAVEIGGEILIPHLNFSVSWVSGGSEIFDERKETVEPRPFYISHAEARVRLESKEANKKKAQLGIHLRDVDAFRGKVGAVHLALHPGEVDERLAQAWLLGGTARLSPTARNVFRREEASFLRSPESHSNGDCWSANFLFPSPRHVEFVSLPQTQNQLRNLTQCLRAKESTRSPSDFDVPSTSLDLLKSDGLRGIKRGKDLQLWWSALQIERFLLEVGLFRRAPSKAVEVDELIRWGAQQGTPGSDLLEDYAQLKGVDTEEDDYPEAHFKDSFRKQTSRNASKPSDYLAGKSAPR